MSRRRYRRPLVLAAAALAFALSHAALASPDAVARDEIDHLLQYVAASSCTFVRNGSEYPAAQARDHLESKYRFVGGRISTADDFIKYLATGSSISGEPYHVRCGNVDALTGPWLTAELNRYRNTPHLTHVAR
jgi:hypothetical protein